MSGPLYITVVSVTLFFLTSIFSYAIIKIISATKRICTLRKDVQVLSLRQIEKRYLVDTINRLNAYYVSYILHSTLCLLCRIFSAVFTVCGFYVANTDSSQSLQQVLSILSVFFVLPSLFLIPQDRAKQYLLVWRKLNSHILELLLKKYDQMSDIEIQKIFDESNKFRNALENSLKKDEEI